MERVVASETREKKKRKRAGEIYGDASSSDADMIAAECAHAHENPEPRWKAVSDMEANLEYLAALRDQEEIITDRLRTQARLKMQLNVSRIKMSQATHTEQFLCICATMEGNREYRGAIRTQRRVKRELSEVHSQLVLQHTVNRVHLNDAKQIREEIIRKHSPLGQAQVPQ